VLTVILTFVGFGLHGGLPDSATAGAVRSYVDHISANQAGIGNYLELVGYVFFLAFAAFLYVVARAPNPDQPNWLAVLALVAATAYVALSAAAIAGQQAMVEWAKAGTDQRAVLGIYILDVEAFTLSFELAALFLAGIGLPLLSMRGMLRFFGLAALVVAAIVFFSGLIGAASISSGINQLGFLLFMLWTLIAGVYLLIRPPRLGSAASVLQ
jgi:hypothetical protein